MTTYILQILAAAAALSTLAGRGASAASTPAVPAPLAQFLGTTDPAGSTGPKACAAQNVLDTCLVQQGQVLAMCSYSDWECKCQAQRTLAGCFNNCPSDGGRTAHEGQVTVFCNAAKRTQEEDARRSAVARPSQSSTPPAGAARPTPSGDGGSDTAHGRGRPPPPRPVAGAARRSAAAAASASQLPALDGAAARHGPLLGLGLGLAAWMAI